MKPTHTFYILSVSKIENAFTACYISLCFRCWFGHFISFYHFIRLTTFPNAFKWKRNARRRKMCSQYVILCHNSARMFGVAAIFLPYPTAIMSGMEPTEKKNILQRLTAAKSNQHTLHN